MVFQNTINDLITTPSFEDGIIIKELKKRFSHELTSFPDKVNYYFIMNSLPYQAFDVLGDGNCYYRAIAFTQYGNEEFYKEVKKDLLKNIHLLKGTEYALLEKDMGKNIKKNKSYADNVSLLCHLLKDFYKKNIQILTWELDTSVINMSNGIYEYSNDANTDCIYILHNGAPPDSVWGHYLGIKTTT